MDPGDQEIPDFDEPDFEPRPVVVRPNLPRNTTFEKVYHRTETMTKQCSNCKKTFLVKNGLYRLHVQKCQKVVKSPHRNNVVPPASHQNSYDTRICPYCKRDLKKMKFTRVKFDEHLQKCKPDLHIHKYVNQLVNNEFGCDLCKKQKKKAVINRHYNKILQHLKENHKDIVGKLVDLEPFKCDKCDKKYAKENDLKDHKKVHDPPGYKCSICQKAFFQHSEYLEHAKNEHGGMKFACNKCGKGFRLKFHLESHQKETCQGKEESEEEPGEVNNSDSDDLNFKAIFNSDNDDDDIIYEDESHKIKEPGSPQTLEFIHCTYCDELLPKTRDQLKVFMTHYGKCMKMQPRLILQKCAQCSTCGKGFESKYLLNCHDKRTHTLPRLNIEEVQNNTEEKQAKDPIFASMLEEDDFKEFFDEAADEPMANTESSGDEQPPSKRARLDYNDPLPIEKSRRVHSSESSSAKVGSILDEKCKSEITNASPLRKEPIKTKEVVIQKQEEKKEYNEARKAEDWNKFEEIFVCPLYDDHRFSTHMEVRVHLQEFHMYPLESQAARGEKIYSIIAEKRDRL